MDDTVVSIDSVNLENEKTLIDITPAPNEEYRSVTPDVIPKRTTRSLSVISAKEQTLTDESSTFAVAINRQTIDAMKTTESTEMVSMTPKNNESSENFKNNYRTSSLKNFDEIVFVDDIKDICIEMKEPNGTAYFVEVEPQDRVEQMEAPSESSGDENAAKKDEKIVLEMLDRVLGQMEKVDNGTKMHETTIDISDDKDSVDVEVQQTTEIALIHVPSDSSPCDEATLENRNSPISNQITEVEVSNDVNVKDVEKADQTVAQVNDEIPTKRESKPTPFFHIGTYKSSEDSGSYKGFETNEQRQNFKEHLKRLLGHGVTQQARTEPRPKRKSSVKRPSLQQSKSTPDGLNLEKEPVLSVKTSEGKIPAPPKFDPMLFNTIGSRLKAQRLTNAPATAQCVENEFEILFQKTLQTPSLQRAPGTEDLAKVAEEKIECSENVEKNSVLSIRDRLEMIFARGRPDHSTCESQPAAGRFEGKHENTEDSEEIVKIRAPKQPFDTVHKQKTLFKNVLKSISPDVRTSLNQTANTTEEAKEKTTLRISKADKPTTLDDAVKFLKRNQNKEESEKENKEAEKVEKEMEKID